MLHEIQKFDYDRYLSLIFAPKDKRDDLVTVILFNLEIARIKSKVTEPMMGLIRLEWWREALDEIFDPARTPRRHNVVSALRELVVKYPQISKDNFLKIINAREKDLDDNPFKTLAEFDEYLLATSYPINKVMLDILFTSPSPLGGEGVVRGSCLWSPSPRFSKFTSFTKKICPLPSREREDNRGEAIYSAVEEISAAWAVCAILRSAYRNFSSNRSVFPADMMEKYNTNITTFGKPEFVENSRPLVKELCDMAEARLIKAKALLKNSPKVERKKAAAILLNIKTTEHHLGQIKKNGYDIFTRNLNPHLGVAGLVSVYIKSLNGSF